MDSQPSTSALWTSPPKKRATLGRVHLSVQEKQAILNMYKKIIGGCPRKERTQIALQISNTLGRHTKAKVWVDVNVTTRRQAFIDGVTTGLKNPVGKGRRLIILHIGSKNGFVDDGLLVFEERKTADCHDEMDADVFGRFIRNNKSSQGTLQCKCSG
ncbi:transposable element tc3 transposase-like protein [Holotrichia oblita]|uniref:Transposable element tc3 transposase-like protein n=1 Tax=Holotrichia oblita TaxID=644536 RepID=A0ACB9TLX0_HOLOL|nr:transposable element tc3 transposase-like protein [Holotrichia oblita]